MPIWRNARNLLAPATSSGALAFWAVGLLAATINLWDVAEQWRDRIQGSRMSTDHFDFIIVGAGTAGSVVASRLSEKYSVLLLEAGGKPFPGTQIPAATLHIQRHKAHDWNFRARRSGEACLACEHGEQVVSAGKMLGGSSALGFNIWSRGHFKDYDAWRDLTGDSRWSYKELSGFFEKAEKQFESGGTETTSSSNFRNRLRSLRSRSSEDSGIQVPENGLHKRPAEIFLQAGASLSNRINLDYKSAEFEQGFGMAYYPMANGRRLSAYDAYVKPVRRMRSDRLTVVKYAEVSKILFEPGSSKKAIGVEFARHGRSHQMFAMKEVILSAGALQSPKLLMLSGIGPRRHLEDLKIPVLLDSPGVGANLQDFESTYIGPFISKSSTHRNSVLIDRDIKPKDFLNWASRGVGTLTNPGIPALGYFNSNHSLSTAAGDSRPDIQYLLNSCAVHSEWSKTFSNAYGLQKSVLDQYISEALRKDSFFVLTSVLRPRRRGQIRLRTGSSAGPLDIQLHSLEDVEDLKVAVQGTKAIVKLIETSPAYLKLQTCLTRKQLPACTKFQLGSDQYWECYWRHLTISRHNYVGTCSMGPSDYAVVDSELRVKGIRDLRVIDASVAPSLPAGGTYAMAVMIGERGAKFIMDDWRNGNRRSSQPVFSQAPNVFAAPKPIFFAPPKPIEAPWREARFSNEDTGNYPTTTHSFSTSSTPTSSFKEPSPSAVDHVQKETSTSGRSDFDFDFTTTTAPEVTTTIPVEKPAVVTNTPETSTSSLNAMLGDDPLVASGSNSIIPGTTKGSRFITSESLTTAPSTPATTTTTTPATVDYDDNGSDFIETATQKPAANGHVPSIIEFEKKADKNDQEKTVDYTDYYDDVQSGDERQIQETTTTTPNQEPVEATGNSDEDDATGTSETGVIDGVSDPIVDAVPEIGGGGAAATLAPKVEDYGAEEEWTGGGSSSSVSDRSDIGRRVEVGNVTEVVGSTTSIPPKEGAVVVKTEANTTKEAPGQKPSEVQETPVEQDTTTASPEASSDTVRDLGISESVPGAIGSLTLNSGSDVATETTSSPISFEIKEDIPATVPTVTPAASLEREAGSEQKTSSNSLDFNVTCTSNTVELRGTTLPSKFEEPPHTTPKQEYLEPLIGGASDPVDLTGSFVANTGLFEGTTTSKTPGDITTTPNPKMNKVNPDVPQATTTTVPRIHNSPVDRAPKDVPTFTAIQTVHEETIGTTPAFGEDTTTMRSHNHESQEPEITTSKPKLPMPSNRSNAGRSFETSEEPQAQSTTPVPGQTSDFVGETTEAISREAIESQPQLNDSFQETTQPPQVPTDDFKSSAIAETTTTKDFVDSTPSISTVGQSGVRLSVLNSTTTFGSSGSTPTATVPTSAVEISTTDAPVTTVLEADFVMEKAEDTTTKRTDFGDLETKPENPRSGEDASSRSSEECGSCLVQSSENNESEETEDSSEQKNDLTTVKPIAEVHETTTAAAETVVEDQTTTTTELSPEGKIQTSTPKPPESNSRGPKFINVLDVQGLNQVAGLNDSKEVSITTSNPKADDVSRRLSAIMPDKVHDLILRINQGKTTSLPESPRETSTTLPELDFDKVTQLVTEDSIEVTTPAVTVDFEVHTTADVASAIGETTMVPKLPENSFGLEVQNKTINKEPVVHIEQNLEQVKYTASTEGPAQVTTLLPESSIDGAPANRLPLIHPGDVHQFLRRSQNKSSLSTDLYIVSTTSQKPPLPEGDVHQRYLVPQSNNLAINFSAYYGEQGDKLEAEISNGSSSKSGVSRNLYGSVLLVFFGFVVSSAYLVL